MLITVLGKRYNLRVPKPENEVREYTFQDLIRQGLSGTDRKIVDILQNPHISQKNTATACILFGIEDFEVTDEQRDLARQRNFLILYGVNNR